MVKIACQTIVFGKSSLKENLTKMAEAVKKTGYDGIETGAGYFRNKTEFYRDLFAKLDLKLTALHTGGDLLNKDNFDQAWENVKETIRVGKEMGCPYIFLSGGWGRNRKPEDYLTEAGYYREIGKMCNDEGLIFCYHNHDWELINNGDGFRLLLENVDPKLMRLVPDVAWLEIAGIPSMQFIRENINRIETFHFKDYKGERNFTELGTGVVPLKEIYDYITGLDRDWWIIAEQDRTELDSLEAARINYEFIASLKK
jgi:sugar phosphate isomerase/epimerase